MYAFPVPMWLLNGLTDCVLDESPGTAAVTALVPEVTAAPEALAGCFFGWQNLTASSFGMNFPSARPMAALKTREPGGFAGASETRVGR